MNATLSEKQIDLLRYLNRQNGAVMAGNLDGRIVRALKSRKFVEVRGGMVRVTEAGRAEAENPTRRKRVRRSRAPEAAPRQARAEAINRALEALELALPKDAEVAVGSIFAYADDVVQGFRKHARRLSTVKRASSGV